MIKEYLNQPYPPFKSKWKLIVFISLFIALFMLIFQPFGSSAYHGSNGVFIIAGYGFVTFITLIVDLFVIQFFFKSLFERKNWTVIKQLFWIIWIIFTIGLGNYLYSAIIFSYWSLNGFLMFQVYTLSVGIIPIVILTILKQNTLLSQNLKSAKDFNTSLNHKDDVFEKQIICLMADNEKDKLEIESSNLLYIESTGNYIRVFYIKDNELKNMLLRCTLKRAELQMKKYPFLIRCHRAFLVNTNKITKVKGNSQGLKLVLNNTGTEIPVSRNFSKRLKDKINHHQY